MSSAMSTLSPEVPSAADALAEYRKYAPKMAVYNAAPEWFNCEYGGNQIYLPPDVGGRMVPHPVEIQRDPKTGEPLLDENQEPIPVMVPGDGICRIGSLFGYVYDRFGRNQGMDLIKGHEAFYIVIFLQRSYAFRGVVWLREPGSPRDLQRMEQAKRLYRQHMRQWAGEQIGIFQQTVANWRKHPGHNSIPQPMPNHAQLKAQEFIDSYQEEAIDVYSCAVCLGYNSKDWNKYAHHMRAAHKAEVKQEDYAPLAKPALVPQIEPSENASVLARVAAAAARKAAEDAGFPMPDDDLPVAIPSTVPAAGVTAQQIQDLLESNRKLQESTQQAIEAANKRTADALEELAAAKAALNSGGPRGKRRRRGR